MPVREFLEPSDAAPVPHTAREELAHTITGYLRRAELSAHGELELQVAHDQESRSPLVTAAIPPTEERVLARILSTLELEAGWAIEWEAENAPPIRVTGFPFANAPLEPGSESRWELRPSWGLVLMKPR